MVFFHTKEEPVPALVREVQHTNQGIWANLTVYIPDFIRKVSGIGGASLSVNVEYYLKEETRARVFLTYPEIVFAKQALKLAEAQVGDNVTQTHTDQWLPVDISRHARLYEVQTNQIGKFFDPRFYQFQIACHKDAYLDLHDNEMPAEDALFPDSLPVVEGIGQVSKGFMDLVRRRANPDDPKVQLIHSYFDDFFSCYEEFFKQKYQLKHDTCLDRPSRWDRVEIVAGYKQGQGLLDYSEAPLQVEPTSSGMSSLLAGG